MDKAVHFEIPVDDIDAAKRFYGGVFGWGLTDFGDGQEYVLATTVEVGPDYRPTEPGAINGALMRRRDDAPAPVLVIEVASVDDGLARVEAAGGAIVRPKTEIPGMGYYAYARDTQGNVIGPWEAMVAS
ncbi:MAG TPA: VOC family protein [Miltoncostaeaceae bacterium]|nr:VOC family protein [Miltoncostaeaceae bacterium]